MRQFKTLNWVAALSMTTFVVFGSLVRQVWPLLFFAKLLTLRERVDVRGALPPSVLNKFITNLSMFNVLIVYRLFYD